MKFQKIIENLTIQGRNLLILISILLNINKLTAQTSRLILQANREKAFADSKLKADQAKDTILHYSFAPVEIQGEYHFKNSREERKYHQLYEDIKRTYPLSQIVSSEVKLVNAELDSLYRTKVQKKAYLKWYEKHIFHTYVDTLRALNKRQIKLFIKLIDREAGSSPYALIKKYRGGMDAFFWQLAANAMLVNLKSEYDPSEDAMIEDIIRKFY